MAMSPNRLRGLFAHIGAGGAEGKAAESILRKQGVDPGMGWSHAYSSLFGRGGGAPPRPPRPRTPAAAAASGPGLVPYTPPTAVGFPVGGNSVPGIGAAGPQLPAVYRPPAGAHVGPAGPASPSARPDMLRGLGTPSGLYGVLAAGMMGGVGGYTMGNQDLSSFAAGAVVGVGAGAFARPMARDALSSAIRHRANNAVAMKSSSPEAMRVMLGQAKTLGKVRTAMNAQEGRYLMHSGGALLAGGAFGGMFMSGNRTNHRRGFNQNRGNTF